MRLKTYFLWLLIFFIKISQAATLVVLDVGEGQSVLLKDGADAILVDTGHAGAAPAVLESLAKYDVTALKAIVLTHLHPDHASGWFRLHEAYPSSHTVYSTHKVSPNALDDMSRWVLEAISSQPNSRQIQRGEVINVGACKIRALWPPGSYYDSNLNANSLVLAVECGIATALLMGDANADVESQLMQMGAFSKPVDLLVVGHHGAADASSPPFLNAVRPTYGAISVNANNFRGYPSFSTIEKLSNIGSQVLQTSREGHLCFQTGLDSPWKYEACSAAGK